MTAMTAAAPWSRSPLLCASLCLVLAASAVIAQGQPATADGADGVEGTATGTGAIEGDLDCQCVPYFLCDPDNRIIDNGQGLIDVRSSVPSCPGDIEVCCRVPNADATPTPSAQPPPQQPEDPYPDPQPQPQPEPSPTPPEQVTPAPAPQPGEPGPGVERHTSNVVVPQTGCGVKRVQETSLRILTTDGVPDDTATFFAEFPWMLAVLVEERIADGRALNRFKCGASLIAPSVALTAAHCINGQEPSALKVRAGEWDTQTRSEPLPHQDRGVTRIVLHPDFRAGPLYNDVALVFLDAPFDLTDNVDTVCLPEPGQVFQDTRCFATGWGRDSFGSTGAYQKILRKVSLPMVDNDECQRRLRETRLGPYFRLHQSFVCAGGEAGRDTCQGDGGGPLVCPLPQDPSRYAQAGVVAWGIGCGENSNPAVYANVAHALTWIESQMRQ